MDGTMGFREAQGSAAEALCPGHKSAFQEVSLNTVLPNVTLVSNRSLPSLSIKKVIFFQVSNLQVYEINIISNELLGKCSPLNPAEGYRGKKKSEELNGALELPGVFKLGCVLHFFSLIRTVPELCPG